jgi:hypothetical protein
VSLAPTQVNSTGLITPISIGVTLSAPAIALSSVNYTNGTGAGQIDLMYEAAISLASTTQTFDLTALTDPAGAAVNFARVRELFVLNYTASAGFDLIVETGAANGWQFVPAAAAPYTCFANGGCYWLRDPNTTGASKGLYTDGTHKNIKVDSGSHTVTFYILILGSSVA